MQTKERKTENSLQFESKKKERATTFLLNSRVRGGGGDAALVVCVAGHVDVALEAPAAAPGVLDEPVVLAVQGAIAGGEHAVVEAGGRAQRRVVHAGVVELERGVGRVDGDGDRADCAHSIEQVVLVVLLDVDVPSHGRADGGRAVPALTIAALIGVRSLGIKAAILCGVCVCQFSLFVKG